MALLAKIRELVERSCPEGWSFQFETERMMNVRADDQPFPCVFLEEYTSEGRYVSRYGWHKHVLLELSFMELAPFQCDAALRERIRDGIEAKAVVPFMEAFNSHPDFEPVEEFTCVAEPPRFDANAVSVLLRFWAVFKMCRP